MFFNWCVRRSWQDTFTLPAISSRRNIDAARLGDALQTCGDTHPIAVDTGFVMDDVALVDSDPVPYSASLFDLCVALRHGPLDGDRALHGVHDAAELSEDPVARRVDDTTTVLPIIRRMTT